MADRRTVTTSMRVLMAALVALAIAPARAVADDPSVYVVAVAAEPNLEPIAARAGAAARASLRSVEGIEWRGPDRRYLGYDASALEALERGREQLAEGRQAYLNLELDQAIRALSSAVESFDQAATVMEDPQDLGDALLLLGASQDAAGRTRDSRRTFERLHVQMPHVEPDPQIFNPDVVARFQAAAPRDQRSATGRIQIDSEPGGAVAYVDFVPRGRTPITVSNLVGGSHVVRVTRPGATPFVQEINLRRGGQESVNAYLTDDEDVAGLADAVRAVSGAEIGEAELDEESPVARVARILDLDKIGVIRVSPGPDRARVRIEVSMYDVASGRRLLRGDGPAPTAPGEIERAVQALVADSLDAVIHQRQAGDEEVPDRRVAIQIDDQRPHEEDTGGGSIASKWWFWAAIGGVVVIGVAATLLLSGGQDLGSNEAGQVVLEF